LSGLRRIPVQFVLLSSTLLLGRRALPDRAAVLRFFLLRGLHPVLLGFLLRSLAAFGLVLRQSLRRFVVLVLCVSGDERQQKCDTDSRSCSAKPLICGQFSSSSVS
jgi:hypothetical protein